MSCDWVNVGLQDPRVTGSNDPLIGANAIETGWFDLLLKSGATIRLRSLPRFVNSFNAAWFLNYDPGALGTPTVFDVQVQAVGTSRLASVPVPVPTPTKTRTIYPFAPAT